MTFITMVHDHHLVRLVLVNPELREDLISLNVLGGEANRFSDMAIHVLLCRSEVEEDYLGLRGLCRGPLGREVALAQDLDVIQVAIQADRCLTIVDVIGKRSGRNSAEVLALAPHQLVAFSCIHDAALFLFFTVVDLRLDMVKFSTGTGPLASFIFVTIAFTQGQQIETRWNLFAIAHHASVNILN